MERMNPWMVGLLGAVSLQALVIGGFLYSARSQKPEAAKPGAPSSGQSAKIDPLKASNVKRVSLTARAVERLDIKTTPARSQQVVRKRSFEGEVLASPQGTVVTAPAAGIVSLPDGFSAAAGTKLAAGQPVLRLAAAPAPALQAGAVQLTAANDRRVPAQPPEASAVSLKAPSDGHLRLYVQPGQAVEAGQPLFEIADDVGALVRVPLSGDVHRVAREKPARVLPIGAKDAKIAAAGWTAQAAQAPQETDPKEAAKALYYRVEEGQDLAGKRVRVEFYLAGSGSQQRTTVPYSAVIYDPHGEAWVYTNPEYLTYVRHRIKVDYIEGDLVVLADGPPAGTAVVMAGAAELFGAEHKLGY